MHFCFCTFVAYFVFYSSTVFLDKQLPVCRDERFLVKPTKTAKAMMPEADLELPYDGAKEMILVDDVENKEFLRELVQAMYEELPTPKKK
ncbi:hypothetical protein SAMN05216544_0778 [Lachnospira pectinoschiza]|uniref:Uncharacterized protein n=1 Tax=Lachnospira pectinoschiza TaxID=28052 RepID=A0A1G9UIG1_9FIRM|nr:hypothetical protein SAMN05216544_0778 [Lachnospira pectinoschiza]